MFFTPPVPQPVHPHREKKQTRPIPHHRDFYCGLRHAGMIPEDLAVHARPEADPLNVDSRPPFVPRLPPSVRDSLDTGLPSRSITFSPQGNWV